jgi:hypothetical protein
MVTSSRDLRYSIVNELLLRLAWVNAFGRTWQGIKDTHYDRRLREYLLPFWAQDFARWERRYGEHGFLFSRFTTLWLLRQALAHSPTNGERPTNEALHAFGEACLIANDVAPNPKTLHTSPRTERYFVQLSMYRLLRITGYRSADQEAPFVAQARCKLVRFDTSQSLHKKA